MSNLINGSDTLVGGLNATAATSSNSVPDDTSSMNDRSINSITATKDTAVAGSSSSSSSAQFSDSLRASGDEVNDEISLTNALGFCHSCNKQVRINLQDYTCSICKTGFIELFNLTDEPNLNSSSSTSTQSASTARRLLITKDIYIYIFFCLFLILFIF